MLEAMATTVHDNMADRRKVGTEGEGGLGI